MVFSVTSLIHFQSAQLGAARAAFCAVSFVARLQRVLGQNLAVPFSASSRNLSLTFRSSMDMKLITTIRPPLFNNPGPIRSNRSNSSGSSFTAIRSAMKVLVAGCKRPVLGTARNTTSARCSVLRMGRARTIALATVPRPPLFAELIDQIGECFFVSVIDQIGRRHARGLIHAHVQRPIRHERKSSLRRRELIPAHTQVRQEPIQLLEARFRHASGSIAKRSVMKPDPVCSMLPYCAAPSRATAHRDRWRSPCRWSAAAAISRRMPAQAGSGIQVHALGPHRQQRQRFVRHDRSSAYVITSALPLSSFSSIVGLGGDRFDRIAFLLLIDLLTQNFDVGPYRHTIAGSGLPSPAPAAFRAET